MKSISGFTHTGVGWKRPTPSRKRSPGRGEGKKRASTRKKRAKTRGS